MTRYVYGFGSCDRPDRQLLGGKGADLAEMVRLGLPVPPGFTITTEACRHFLATGSEPPGLDREVVRNLALLERRAGRRLGDEQDPLLLSVRSGAAVSMPGMMDTVLNIGLNDRSVEGLARSSGDERFALDCYRRLVQMLGETVFGASAELFGNALDSVKADRRVDDDVELDADALREVLVRNRAIFEEQAGRSFPQDPHEQLDLAIKAVFRSWHSERAALYRRRHGIPDGLGTAVNVQKMVFGNRRISSGSGVAFTRDPATGAHGDYGEYLPSAQGEDVVSGVRTAVPLSELARLDPASYRRLRSLMGTLERHYRDMCDIEFTIEDGQLWMLQTRVGKRSAAAAFRIASELVEEGWIDLDEALGRVSGEQLGQLMFPRFERVPDRSVLTTGLSASPGAAVGRLVLDSPTAVEWAARGEDVVLVRKETRPEDLAGMVAARAVLTSRGGRTSHAAVVARAMGRPCVCGAADLEIDTETRRVTVRGGPTLSEGDVVSVDGSSGEVFLGALATTQSDVTRWFDGGPVKNRLVEAVAEIVGHADDVRRLAVRVNADTAADAARALRLGAEGIGLCRTEHMFLGDRRGLVQRFLLADEEEDRRHALDGLLHLQREDFAGIFGVMEGRAVTVRLLDAPLHEFLPDLTELAVRVALQYEHGRPSADDDHLLAAVRRMHEENPMTGLRGIRLGILFPALVATQARAAFEAAADHRDRGGSVDLELMVPLVSTVAELTAARRLIEGVAAEVAAARGQIGYRLGTMVETPRAALTAGELAAAADFLSCGTNDLTQLTWGFSRDDVESSFLPRYLDSGVLLHSPFESLDVDGVGELARMAVERAREASPRVVVGVCGEHGGDPSSIHYFDQIGVDYVSCSPFRVPVARLEAGRAALAHRRRGPSAASDDARPGSTHASNPVVLPTDLEAAPVGGRS